jgi:hypothetical protein
LEVIKLRKKLISLGMVVALVVAMMGITPAVVAAAGDEYPPLEATTPAGALFGKFFVLTDRILGQLVNTSYDAEKEVYIINGPTEDGNIFISGFTIGMANFMKILGDTMRMLAGTPVE